MKPGAKSGFFVERAALFCVTKARVQHGRTAFDKGGFIPPLLFNTKQPRGHKNIKPPLSASAKAAQIC
jgi:hypothetical protein